MRSSGWGPNSTGLVALEEEERETSPCAHREENPCGQTVGGWPSAARKGAGSRGNHLPEPALAGVLTLDLQRQGL